MSHRASLEASYTTFLSKKQAEYKSSLTIKDWLKQIKALFQASLADKLQDYKSEFLSILKKCDENSSLEFFRCIQWVNRSFQPGMTMRSNASTFQKSKITVLSIEPSQLSISFDQVKAHNSFKKFLSIMNHEIKFGKGILTKIVECFASIFVQKYTQAQSSCGPHGGSTKNSSGAPLAYLYSSFSSIFKNKPTFTPSKSSKKLSKSGIDYKAILINALQEIKEFRSVVTKLLQHQIKHSRNFSNIEWTPEEHKLLFEAVNSLLFGWSNQFYSSIMGLIGSALQEKQSEFVIQAGIMKHLSTKEFHIHTAFRLKGESHAYLGAIEAVNMISQHFTPEDKFKSILAIKTELIREVDQYWGAHDPKKSISELVIQEEELLPLYTFIISRSNGGKLLSELYFTEQFLEPDALHYSEASSSFNALNAAVSYILSLTKQKGLSHC